jgi:hypothetical protein
MNSEKKLCETYKEKKMKEFKQELDNLLDRYEFSGWRRQTVEEQCMSIVQTQIAYADLTEVSSQLELELKKKG